MINKSAIMPDFTGGRYRFHYLTAINLLECMGLSLGDIHIRAAGQYENYRGEIRSQDPEAGAAIAPGSQIVLEVGCDSAVDFMPYQFFYGLQGIRDTGDKWETDARSLLAPFDAARIRYEAAMRMHALRYDFGVTDAGHIKKFVELFEYRDTVEDRGAGESVFLAAILPSLHMWGGNPSAVTMVLKRLFGYDARIRENVRTSTAIPGEMRYRLGSKTEKLGSGTVIGGSFDECDSMYEVEFTGVPPADVRELLPGGRTRRRIERFLDFCMPGDVDYRISVRVKRTEAGAGRERFLGYSTYL